MGVISADGELPQSRPRFSFNVPGDGAEVSLFQGVFDFRVPQVALDFRRQVELQPHDGVFDFILLLFDFRQDDSGRVDILRREVNFDFQKAAAVGGMELELRSAFSRRRPS